MWTNPHFLSDLITSAKEKPLFSLSQDAFLLLDILFWVNKFSQTKCLEYAVMGNSIKNDHIYVANVISDIKIPFHCDFSN